MTASHFTDDRYKQAIIPALIMGVLTNGYITWVLLFVHAYEALFSPVIGTAIFVTCLLLLNVRKMNANQAFLITAFTVLIEIFVHTHYLGWDCGFFYFTYLLPAVFLLNSNWKTGMAIFFNGIVAVAMGILYYLYRGKTGIHPITKDVETYLNLFNAVGASLVMIVVLIYFSRTIYKKDEALIKANIALERQNKEISNQHSHLQILLKEVHHRVKNNLQIISSLMSLQKRTVDDPEVAKVFEESKRRVEAIALIHQKLYQEDQINRVDVKSYIEELMSSQQVMNPLVKCTVKAEAIKLDLDIAVPLGLIISELVTNAMKHAFLEIENPTLIIKLVASNKIYELTVQDNGVGLPENFDLENPLSLGTEIIAALTDQINARIEWKNENGAKFHIIFNDSPALN